MAVPGRAADHTLVPAVSPPPSPALNAPRARTAAPKPSEPHRDTPASPPKTNPSSCSPTKTHTPPSPPPSTPDGPAPLTLAAGAGQQAPERCTQQQQQQQARPAGSRRPSAASPAATAPQPHPAAPHSAHGAAGASPPPHHHQHHPDPFPSLPGAAPARVGMGRGGLAARLGSAPLPSSRRRRDWGKEPGAGTGEAAPSRRRHSHSRGAAPDGADPAATALRGALKWRPRCLCPARAAPKGRGVGVCPPTRLPEIPHHSFKGCSRPQAQWGSHSSPHRSGEAAILGLSPQLWLSPRRRSTSTANFVVKPVPS